MSETKEINYYCEECLEGDYEAHDLPNAEISADHFYHSKKIVGRPLCNEHLLEITGTEKIDNLLDEMDEFIKQHEDRKKRFKQICYYKGTAKHLKWLLNLNK